MFKNDTTRRWRLACLSAVTAAALVAPGCNGDQALAPDGQGSTLAVAPGDPEANGTVRGLVQRWDASGSTPPVPGVTVKVHHMVRDPSSPPDSILYVPELVGTVVTDSDGRFELFKVPEGQYSLWALPPSGSPCLPTSSWEITAPGTGILDASITLLCGSGRLTTGSDSTPPDSAPPDSVPGDSVPGDSVPGDSVPGDSLPGDSTPPPPPGPTATSIVVQPERQRVAVGDSGVVYATVRDSLGREISAPIVWELPDARTAIRIDVLGPNYVIFTAVARGRARVIARHEQLADTGIVIVR